MNITQYPVADGPDRQFTFVAVHSDNDTNPGGQGFIATHIQNPSKAQFDLGQLRVHWRLLKSSTNFNDYWLEVSDKFGPDGTSISTYSVRGSNIQSLLLLFITDISGKVLGDSILYDLRSCQFPQHIELNCYYHPGGTQVVPTPVQPQKPAGLYTFFGWQVLSWDEQVFAMVARSKALHVMTLDANATYLKRIKVALPGVKVLFRPYLAKSDYHLNAAEAWTRCITPISADTLALVDELETPYNEPPCSTQQEIAKIAKDNLDWIDLCKQHGKVPVTLALAVGNPGNLDLWDGLKQVCTETAQADGFIATHQYSLNLSSDVQRDLEWTANRHEKEVERCPWLSTISRYITECGYDTPSWKQRGISPAKYADYLLEQASYWQNHAPFIQACFPFCVGTNGDARWNNFRYDDTEAGGIVASALALSSVPPPQPTAQQQARAIQIQVGKLVGDVGKQPELVQELVQAVNNLVKLFR